MEKIKLRVNSKGWWWVWGLFRTDYWGLNEVIVGPEESAAAAYDIATRFANSKKR